MTFIHRNRLLTLNVKNNASSVAYFDHIEIDLYHSDTSNIPVKYILDNNPNHLRLEAVVPQDGYLVRKENFHAGWSAKVNNTETPVEKYAGVFQAVKVNYAVLGFGPASILVPQGCDATVFHRPLRALEGVSLPAHNLAGFRHVAQLFSQIQQTDLVFDDLLVSMQHEGYLFGFDGLVRTAIKTGNPLLFHERCQIKSELLHI